MRALINFFGDNAMFYKDITQWMRNRTFASLFFGLLLVAEALSLFIIAGSDDIANPGVSMFYTLYLVLIIYALLIAYMGNGLTSREFVNRTFELFELSGMSLERMVGGKILSMLYQFFFGFFCLVPFMFFAYFLGGLDFVEMLVGVVMMGILALPLYLASLLAALTGRFKQIAILAKLASVFTITMFSVFAVVSFFTNEPIMQEIVRELTDFLKQLFNGSVEALVMFVISIAVYVQVCLLTFYFCCDSIARESDSREIPIKVLISFLVISWMAFCGAEINFTGNANAYYMVAPVFLSLLALGARTFYNRASVPPIVARKYAGAKGFNALFFWLLKPGIQGSVRTLFTLIALAIITGAGAVYLMPIALGGSALGGGSTLGRELWSGFSLLVQIPWFLAIPHMLFAKNRELRYNYAGQRTIAVAWWVVLGALVMIFLAWTKSSIFVSSVNPNSLLDIFMVTLLSPLPSLLIVGSEDIMLFEFGSFIRIGSGIVGALLMLAHMRGVVREEARATEDNQGPTTGEDSSDGGATNQALSDAAQ